MIICKRFLRQKWWSLPDSYKKEAEPYSYYTWYINGGFNPLKHTSQNGNLPQIGVNNFWNHHLVHICTVYIKCKNLYIMYIHVYIVFDEVCVAPRCNTPLSVGFQSCPQIANRQNASKASARALQISGIMSIRSLEMTWSQVPTIRSSFWCCQSPKLPVAASIMGVLLWCCCVLVFMCAQSSCGLQVD